MGNARSSQHGIAAVLALALSGIALPTAAHQDHHGHGAHQAPAERIELGFGRTPEFDYDPPEPGTYRLPPIEPAADGTVIDAAGRSLRLSEAMDGRITVLSFIYTRCADPAGCPAAVSLLHDIAHVGRNDAEIGDNVALLSLSFDPRHDTPEVMADYSAAHGPQEASGAEWRFLTTGSEAALAPILAAYRQPVGYRPDAADPFGPISHTLKVFLIDRQGMIRNVYSIGFLDPRLVLTDIRTLLIEERERSAQR